MLKAMCIYPVCSKHNKGTLHLPVVIVTTEETASAHVDVLLFFLLLFLLLLLLLLLSGSIASSSGSGYESRANEVPTSGGSSTARRLHEQLANILLTEVLGEQHGPVGLHGVVGGLEELRH